MIASLPLGTSDGTPDGSPLLRPFPESRHIPFDLIDPNPDQPRRTLEGVEELAQHVKQYGLLQPIVVTPGPQGRFTLVAGHRRLAALRWLARHDDYPQRWRDVPAVIRTVEGDERLTLALAENLSRHALSDAEIVTSLRLLLDLHGWSQAEIARRLGVSRQWLSHYARVLDAPDLAAHVQAGRLSAAKAYEVQCARSPDARRAALDAALDSATLREIRSLAAGGPADLAGAPAAPNAGDETPAHLPAPSTPDRGTSRVTSPAPPFDEGETDSHTLPVYRDDTRPAACPAAPAQEPPVALRTLAIQLVLQEARRHRRTSLPAQTLRAALLTDLRALGAPPRKP